MSASRNKIAVQRVLARQDWSRQFLESLAGLLFSLVPYAEFIPEGILHKLDRALSKVVRGDLTREASPLGVAVISVAANKALKASRKPHIEPSELDALLLLIEPFLTVLDWVTSLIEKLFGKGPTSEVSEKVGFLDRLYRRGPVRN